MVTLSVITFSSFHCFLLKTYCGDEDMLYPPPLNATILSEPQSWQGTVPLLGLWLVWFWWLGLAENKKQAIKNLKHCLLFVNIFSRYERPIILHEKWIICKWYPTNDFITKIMMIKKYVCFFCLRTNVQK